MVALPTRAAWAISSTLVFRKPCLVKSRMEAFKIISRLSAVVMNPSSSQNRLNYFSFLVLINILLQNSKYVDIEKLWLEIRRIRLFIKQPEVPSLLEIFPDGTIYFYG
jgi:hypothetical protein